MFAVLEDAANGASASLRARQRRSTDGTTENPVGRIGFRVTGRIAVFSTAVTMALATLSGP